MGYVKGIFKHYWLNYGIIWWRLQKSQGQKVRIAALWGAPLLTWLVGQCKLWPATRKNGWAVQIKNWSPGLAHNMSWVILGVLFFSLAPTFWSFGFFFLVFLGWLVWCFFVGVVCLFVYWVFCWFWGFIFVWVWGFFWFDFFCLFILVLAFFSKGGVS